MAKTVQNLYENRPLHSLIGGKSELQLWRDVYDFAPTGEVGNSLLHVLVDGFEYKDRLLRCRE